MNTAAFIFGMAVLTGKIATCKARADISQEGVKRRRDQWTVERRAALPCVELESLGAHRSRGPLAFACRDDGALLGGAGPRDPRRARKDPGEKDANHLFASIIREARKVCSKVPTEVKRPEAVEASGR